MGGEGGGRNFGVVLDKYIDLNVNPIHGAGFLFWYIAPLRCFL